MENTDVHDLSGCNIVYLNDNEVHCELFKKRFCQQGATVSTMWSTGLPSFSGKVDFLVIYQHSLGVWYRDRDDDLFEFLKEFKQQQACQIVFIFRWFEAMGPEIQERVTEISDFKIDEFPQTRTESVWEILPKLWDQQKKVDTNGSE